MKIAELIYLTYLTSTVFFSFQDKKAKEQYAFENIPSIKLDSINMVLTSSNTSK